MFKRYFSSIGCIFLILLTSTNVGAQETYQYRFFEIDAYRQLSSAAKGHRLSFIKSALEKFQFFGEKSGIRENQITAAVLRGQLVPHFDDLLLVHESFGKPDTKNSSLTTTDIYQPPNYYEYSWGKRLFRYRETEWVRKFGRIPDEYLFILAVRLGQISISDLSIAPVSADASALVTYQALKRKVVSVAFSEVGYISPRVIEELYHKFSQIGGIQRAVDRLGDQDLGPIAYFLLQAENVSMPLNTARRIAKSQYASLRQRYLEEMRFDIQKEEDKRAESRSNIAVDLRRVNDENQPELEVSGSPIGAFFYTAWNSAFYEYGDKIFCKLFAADGAACEERQKQIQLRNIRENRTAVIIGTIFGYFITPVAATILGMMGKAVTAADVFRIHFFSEIFEGFLSASGEYLTFNDGEAAFLTIIFASLAGFLRGSMLAMMHKAKKGILGKIILLTFATLAIVTVVGVYNAASADTITKQQDYARKPISRSCNAACQKLQFLKLQLMRQIVQKNAPEEKRINKKQEGSSDVIGDPWPSVVQSFSRKDESGVAGAKREHGTNNNAINFCETDISMISERLL